MHAKKGPGQRIREQGLRCLATLLVGLLAVLSVAAQQSAPDWQPQVRDLVARQELNAALAIVDKRLAEAPQDLEARGWRARLLTWTDHLPQAEAEYRRVLDSAPKDTDMLSGLASVLAREQCFAESLALLNKAKALDAGRSDIRLQRARVLRAMGRDREAHEDFAAAARLDSKDAEARAMVHAPRGEPRHLLRIGNDTDFFNYTDTAAAQTVSLDSRLAKKWATSFAGSAWERFGARAGKFTGSTLYRLNRDTSLSAGGAFANDQGVIPTGESFFGLDRGFRLSEATPVRGLEVIYDQHWFWYRTAHILTISPSLLFYFPGDWTFLLKGTAARSGFSGLAPEWRPSGMAKLGFPLVQNLTGNVFFAVGTENFARVDQLASFSARTYGGGVKYQITPRQDLTFSTCYQSRTQGRTQTSFGLSYGLRF